LGLGLGFVFINSLFIFETSIVLSLITLYLYINLFPIETKILKKASKGGKPDRNPYHPYGFINPYKTIYE
jgi:hypothetical protein